MSEFLHSYIPLLLATFCGGAIGIQREFKKRGAGFRTHLLVCLGSALFTLISIKAYLVFPQVNGFTKNFDPTRIAAQIVSGIGFLGAGAIMKNTRNISGITTAACLWVTAAIGMACGFRLYSDAIFCTILTLVTLIILKYIEVKYLKNTIKRKKNK